MNNHEVESILCMVRCPCCDLVYTYDEDDLKKIDIDHDVFTCRHCQHREPWANIHAIVGAKFVKTKN